MTGNPPHVPVLLDEVIAALAIAPGETHVDATFGAGGYSRAMLAAGGRVIAFDRDPDAVREGAALVEEAGGHLTLIEAQFSALAAELEARDLAPVDGVTMDIGVSSMQLDRAERGFSFQADGPLDMRMSQAGESAADFVNAAEESAIADVLYLYGDEPRSRRVARAIVAARPLTRTTELANVVRRALGHKPHDKKDPATRAFQAIRIHLNRELGELEDGLIAAEAVLRPGGRLAVVTFHSPGGPAGQAVPARSRGADAVRLAPPPRGAGGARAQLRSAGQGGARIGGGGRAQSTIAIGDVARGATQ